MYESPVEIMSKRISFEQEEGIVRAIQEYGININKEELIKAMQYDRNQYQKGYDDGFSDAKNQAQFDLMRLKENLAEAHLDIKEHMAEIERLKKDIETVTNYHGLKSEAIKEFAERLCDGRVSNDPVVIAVKTELKMTESPTKIEHNSLCETETYQYKKAQQYLPKKEGVQG